MVDSGRYWRTEVDHINGNGLDNRRQNLRICTRQQNKFNRTISSSSTTGYKGVSFHIGRGQYIARAKYNYRLIHLGYYDDPVDAARAYNNFVIEKYGEFAKINKLPSRKEKNG